jgi:hypothetical protein
MIAWSDSDEVVIMQEEVAARNQPWIKEPEARDRGLIKVTIEHDERKPFVLKSLCGIWKEPNPKDHVLKIAYIPRHALLGGVLEPIIVGGL